MQTPIRRLPSKLCAILAVSRRLRMDGVHHLALQILQSNAIRRFRWKLPALPSRQTIKPCCGLIRSISNMPIRLCSRMSPSNPGRRDRRPHWSERRRQDNLLEVLTAFPAESSDVHWLEGCCRRRVGEKPCSTYRTACGLIRTNRYPVLSFFANVYRRSADEIPTRSKR